MVGPIVGPCWLEGPFVKPCLRAPRVNATVHPVDVRMKNSRVKIPLMGQAGVSSSRLCHYSLWSLSDVQGGCGKMTCSPMMSQQPLEYISVRIATQNLTRLAATRPPDEVYNIEYVPSHGDLGDELWVLRRP